MEGASENSFLPKAYKAYAALVTYFDGAPGAVIFGLALLVLHPSTHLWTLKQVHLRLKHRLTWLAPLQHSDVRGSIYLALYLSIICFCSDQAKSHLVFGSCSLIPAALLVAMTQRFLTGKPPIPRLMLYSTLAILLVLPLRLIEFWRAIDALCLRSSE